MNLSRLGVKKIYICLTAFVLALPFAQAADQAAFKFKPWEHRLKQITPADIAASLKLNTPSEINPNGELILDLKKLEKIEINPNALGPRTGGGGNACALAIVQTTNDLKKRLDVLTKNLGLTDEQSARLQKVMSEARFVLKPKLSLKGEKKDAINYPEEAKIEMTRKFCATEMIESTGRSMGLLFHEYLGLARIDDRKYQISSRFLEGYAELISEDYQFRKSLESEAAKDMRGQPSCFKGELKKKDQEMAENYGGRYQSVTPSLSIMKTSEENNRFFDKYCDVRYDKNKKRIKDEDDTTAVAFRRCNYEENTTYLASAAFEFSTSGTYGQEAQVFQVVVKSVTNNLIDVRLDQEDNGYATPLPGSRSVTCQLVQLPETP